MSGTFQHRVNRLWSQEQANMSVPAFFWEWLKFVQDHPGLSFVGYGTGKSASGTTPPAAWIDDFDPTTDSNPYGDNSWFVFEASNADVLLNGGGGMPWQAKIQMTTSTGFDDCNVADINYGMETNTWTIGIRCSPGGDWDNVTDLDFEPVGGEEISTNFRLFEGQNINYILDIIGDDDTIFWDGAGFTGELANAASRSRGGYLGMLIRRSDVITYPFFMTLGSIEDSGTNVGESERAINERYNDDDAQWGPPSGTEYMSPGLVRWPSFSLWSDGTKIEGKIKGDWPHAHDVWVTSDVAYITPDPVTSDIVVPSCIVAQWKAPVKYAIMGEYRLIGATAYEFGHGVVVGSNADWRQFCYNSMSRGGMLMMWPAGVAAIWS